MQIPKNVMQYGEIDPHVKIYMEDYVHTFLEQSRRPEVYLVFGKKETRGDISYYMIYGVERKSDWDRGSYPYFKRQERLGTLDGPADSRVFRPVRGNGIALDGYFVFYEQNEDMQSYMISVRERDSLPGSEEREEVMEAVRLRRELRRQDANEKSDGKEAAAADGKDGGQAGTEPAAARTAGDAAADTAAEGMRRDRNVQQGRDAQQSRGVRRGRSMQHGRSARRGQSVRHGLGMRFLRAQNAAKRSEQRRKAAEMPDTAPVQTAGTASRLKRKTGGQAALRSRREPGRRPARQPWTVPELCRLGCMILALLLVAVGLTSVNRYPDMAAVTRMFSEAVEAVRSARPAENKEGSGRSSLIVEETQLETEAFSGTGPEEASESLTPGAGDLFQAEGGETVNWRIGQDGAEADEAAGPGTAGSAAENGADGSAGEGGTAGSAAEAGTSELAEGSGSGTSEKETADSGRAENAGGGTSGSGASAGEAAKTSDAEDASAADVPEAVKKDGEGQGGNAPGSDGDGEFQQTAERPEAYTVRRGDNLAAISRRFYGSDEMVAEICALNKIKNPDQIVPGQNILLP